MDENKHELWTWCPPDGMLKPPYDLMTGKTLSPRIVRRDGAPYGVVIATDPLEGDGKIWLLSAEKGERIWRHDLTWTPRAHEQRGKLNSHWQRLVDWPGLKDPVIVVSFIEGGDWPTCLEFLSLDEEVLGTYYHPGHLHFYANPDLDKDGRREVLLYGYSNWAYQMQLEMFPGSEDRYPTCLVLLELPDVAGQAYPYDVWLDVPRATEVAYLLVFPLCAELEGKVTAIDIFRPPSRETEMLTAVYHGHIRISLDHRLKPGKPSLDRNSTLARSLPPEATSMKFYHFQQGQIDTLVRQLW
jgi:hypothetical protein